MKFTDRTKIIIILILLTITASLLRIPWLGTSHCASGDETMWGRVARNILVNPLYALNPTHRRPLDSLNPETKYELFNRFTAYPLLIAIPIAILGPSHFSLRIINCLCGVILVLLIFFLARRTLGLKEGIAGGLAMATLPAAIMFSRMAYNEGLVAVLGLIVVGIVLSKHFPENKKFAGVAGILTGYGYLVKAFEVLVIIGPVLLLLIFLFTLKKTWKWILVFGGTFILVILIPLGLRALLTPWAVPNGLSNLWFSDQYSWTQPFGFYFKYITNEFSLWLPFIACGVMEVVRRSFQSKADRRILVWLLMAMMIVLISLPQTKKHTYSLILFPALIILTGAGVVFVSRLRSYSWIWKGPGIMLLLGLPILGIINHWMPLPHYGNYVNMDKPFLLEWWPRALWIVLGINLLVVAWSFLKRNSSLEKCKFSFSALIITLFIISFASSSGGLIAGQKALHSHSLFVNRDWQPQALARLQEAIIQAWPNKTLLVGFRAHSADIVFHYPRKYFRQSSARPLYPIIHDKKRTVTIIRKIKREQFPFFADSLEIPLHTYIQDPSVIQHLPSEAQKFYEITSIRYKDVTEWFRKSYDVRTSVRVYRLKHLQTKEIRQKLKDPDNSLSE